MLDGNKLDDLSRLYKLFGRPGVPTGIKELKRALKESVKERGEKINEGGGGALVGGGVTPGESVEKEKEKEDGDVAAVEGAKGKGKPTKELGGTAVALANAIRWVQNVLDLKDKFDGVLRDAFAGDKGIQTAINEVRFSHPSVSCLCPFSS
jgi:cullin 3